MNIEISSPDGEVVFKKKVSGTSEAVEQGEVASMAGEWTVQYEWNDYTGDYVTQVIGM